MSREEFFKRPSTQLGSSMTVILQIAIHKDTLYCEEWFNKRCNVKRETAAADRVVGWLAGCHSSAPAANSNFLLMYAWLSRKKGSFFSVLLLLSICHITHVSGILGRSGRSACPWAYQRPERTVKKILASQAKSRRRKFSRPLREIDPVRLTLPPCI